MKCPFCGAELEKEQGSERWWYCVNAKCVHKYTTTHETIWQTLIDGKKAQDALKVAIKGIKEIEYDNERGLGEGGGLYSDDTPFEELLKEITSITTQKKE